MLLRSLATWLGFGAAVALELENALVYQLDFKHTCAPAKALLPSVRTETVRLKRVRCLILCRSVKSDLGTDLLKF